MVALLLWMALRFVRRTRAQRALLGMAILGAVYAGARALDLTLTAALFQGFFAVLVIVVVVVFQEDLRRLFEQIGSWRRTARTPSTSSDSADLITRAASKLAASRTGALIVVPGREPLDRHLEGGIDLAGRLSEPLLLSIFDSSSPGHDGAVLIRGRRLVRFALHLPLSSDTAQLGPGGTRHAAALGLAERSDALCVVVSEERGTISLARHGVLRLDVGADDVVAAIRDLNPVNVAPVALWRRSWRFWLEGITSLALALLLWVAFVPGADLTERTVPVRVVVEQLPSGYRLGSVEPSQVSVRLTGLQRDLVLLQPSSLSVRVNAELAALGRRTFPITPENVRGPAGAGVLAVEPDRIKVDLVEGPPTPATP